MKNHPYEDVAADIVKIVDWETLGIPKGHGTLPVFRSLSRRLWLDSDRDIRTLYTASMYLCLYGVLDRAREVATLLTTIPNGGPVWYMYVNSCIVWPCCFLERAGDTEAARPLRQAALNPPGKPYQPGSAALDGSMLWNFFSNPEYDPSMHADWPMHDIDALTCMWVYGSTVPEWTKEKIGELIDINWQELWSMPKWRPWR
ncbi:MAG: hypothetical protein LBI33_03240 [Propionibacteriaceae bacterium]|jgi:hypothetical protein|nr:hypothetical protein [Propionibacteriaceae bacterium]